MIIDYAKIDPPMNAKVKQFAVLSDLTVLVLCHKSRHSS